MIIPACFGQHGISTRMNGGGICFCCPLGYTFECAFEPRYRMACFRVTLQPEAKEEITHYLKGIASIDGGKLERELEAFDKLECYRCENQKFQSTSELESHFLIHHSAQRTWRREREKEER